MSGDINLLEYKNKMYEFGIATNKIDINYNNFEKRYEFKNDKSSKFWTIKYYKNGEFLTTYGKVGTKGKKSSKKKILNVKKLIDSKIKKGYKIKKE